ncbi:NAD(P)-dependent alcohol dehydrogenase [Arthrobacter sp. UCD-GKA]|uniref:NAD(P)-dependent alcohol dehydrogenase n=1 Tax=Arthrobacter sp. UCD-GKA TaxID=1913576 RepID=UPI0008DCE494|nr:NAD(P)-dependent alcohol dehydrogenase [Arthrobacter sp. UCD-GKA]OIH85189.1 NAD(P)-dependent alcohol dehydrogenase [Arthrobacter sp. UCD-GKA]
MKISAATLEGVNQKFAIKEMDISDPVADEVLVEIAGVGLCHTDLAVQHGQLPFAFPGVVGHEGSGTVVAVGPDVTGIAVGDRVGATFNSCGECTQCNLGMPSYCVEFMARNFTGSRPDGSSPLSLDGGPVGSYFFGQSSFATHAIARERNVVKLVEGIALELAGPLGCGVQTGAGAVLRSLPCAKGESLLVVGGGSVGLSAVLGAVVREMGTIIVAEPVAARRELALSLGATHVIDPNDGLVSEQVRAVLPEGVNYAIDTTASVKVLTDVIAAMSQRGTVGMLGVPSDPTAELALGLLEIQARGLSFKGIVEGDSDPEAFIPELVQYHLEGRFPFDKLITKMPLSQINEAIEAQGRGEVLKVVLIP